MIMCYAINVFLSFCVVFSVTPTAETLKAKNTFGVSIYNVCCTSVVVQIASTPSQDQDQSIQRPSQDQD